MSDDIPRATVREGGEVDGEQYYVIDVRDETNQHGSAALTIDGVRKLADELEQVLEND